jgi:hypothetical protein
MCGKSLMEPESFSYAILAESWGTGFKFAGLTVLNKGNSERASWILINYVSITINEKPPLGNTTVDTVLIF